MINLAPLHCGWQLVGNDQPTNGASLLAIQCEVLPEGQRILSWHGVANRLYTFEYADSLGANDWQSYPFEVTGFDQTISFWDASDLSARFYRVKVRLP